MTQVRAVLQWLISLGNKPLMLLVGLFTSSLLFAQGPTISYTPLPNSCLQNTPQTLTATITDAAGVPLSGAGVPTLYWRRNFGPYNAVSGTSIGGDQYTFTFGGDISGTVISYYIAAQNNLNEVSVMPSVGASGLTANPPAAATPPDFPSQFIIQNTMSGVYTIGIGGLYSFLTITDAVNAYNNSCLAGNITFLLQDNDYNASRGEIFPITIFNPGANAARKLTIRPNPGKANVNIVGSSNDAIFRLFGADFVTIEGRASADPANRARNITIQNKSNNSASSVIWISSNGTSNPATYNTISHCKIIGNGTDSTYAGIAMSGPASTTSSAETYNNNNDFYSNQISKVQVGISMFGESFAGDEGNKIRNNQIGFNTGLDSIGFRGIFADNQRILQIDSNWIRNVKNGSRTQPEMEPTAGIYITGISTQTTIQNNTIQDIRDYTPGGFPVFGIGINTSSTNSNLRIQNNFILNLTSTCSADDPMRSMHGIAILDGGNIKIYYNSVSLQGVNPAFPAGVYPFITSALFTGPNIITPASLDVRNNIFHNRLSVNSFRYGLYCSTNALIFNNINYNDYWAITGLGYMGGTRNNIAIWQLATGQDVNSVAVDPKFISATSNLHLQDITPLNNIAQNVGVSTDIDFQTRNLLSPDIGADEINPPDCTDNLGGTVTANVTQICRTGSPILFASGFSYGTGINYQWQRSSDGITFTNLAGEKNPTTATPPVISATTYYRLQVSCKTGPYGYSNVKIVPVNSPQVLSSTTVATRCGVGKVSLAATGSPGTTLRWYDVPVNGEIMGTGGTFLTPNVYENDSFYVEANIGGVNTQVGPVSPSTHGGTIGYGLTSWETYFNILVPTKLLSVDIYPKAAGQNSNLVIYAPDSSVLFSYNYTTVVGGGATAQTIPINLSLDPGEGYFIWSTGYEDFPTDGLSRNNTGTNYPYTSPEAVITGNGFLPQYYMYYYRWRFSSGCQSTPRKLVKVNLNPPPAVTITATDSTVCANSPTTLQVTSANPNYIYSWQPGGLVGPTVSVTPTGYMYYKVLANDGNCAIADSIEIKMKAQPEPVISTPVTLTQCGNDIPSVLSVTGGSVNGDILLSEGFNGASLPVGWLKAQDFSQSAFNLKPDDFRYQGYTFHSNDLTQFLFSTIWTTASNSIIRTPKINALGYSKLTLTFWHHFYYFSRDSVFVQVMDSPTPPVGTSDVGWTNVAVFNQTQGTSIAWKKATINLDAWAGNANLYIRIKFKGNAGGFWYALDNVLLTGNDAPPMYTWTPSTGLFSDAAGSIPYLGEDINTVYASPDTTVEYVVTSTGPNGCRSFDTTKINVRMVGGVMSGDNTICAGGVANLSVNFTGTPPYSFTYTDGVTPATITGILTNPYVFPVMPTANTVYTLTSVSDSYCTANPIYVTGTATVNLTSIGVSSWLGNSSDWFDQANWCGLVPDATINAIVPAGLSNYPTISSGVAHCKNLNISPGGMLSISSTGKLEISGSTNNEGVLTNNGEILITGSGIQTFPGFNGTVNAMNVLEINNSGTGVLIDKELRITGMFKPTRGIIALQDTVTIASDAAGTASIGIVGNDVQFIYAAGLGKFVVERYIPNHDKAWQLLSAATFGQTMKEAWQEGAVMPLDNPHPGYGTIMTSINASALVDGFDIYTPLGSTLNTYDPVTNTWQGVPNTHTWQVSNTQGYMIFVRGDRSVQTYNAPATAVTLRTIGEIYYPVNPPAPTAVPVGKFQSIGNPYASAVDFINVRSASPGVDNKFYVWDPSLPGNNNYGRYQTVSSVNGYRPLPGSALYPSTVPMTQIQSGQAFMVYSTVGGSVSFNENQKIAGSNQVFRESVPANRQFLYASLFTGDMLSDGNVVALDDEFTNSFDADDATKLPNPGKNFGIMANGKLLAVNARKNVISTDTVFYNLTGVSAGVYAFVFSPQNMDGTMEAWLVDRFTNNMTTVSLLDSTRISFTVSNATGSKAANRFYLVFRKINKWIDVVAMPADWVTVKLQWLLYHAQQQGIFSVQRSLDKVNWNTIGTVPADGTHGTSNYEFVDDKAKEGNNFYRIIWTSSNGEEKTKTVMVDFTLPTKVSVYPNPVTGNSVVLKTEHLSPGKYHLDIIASDGKVVYAKTIVHNNEMNHPLSLPKALPAGMYVVSLQNENGKYRMKLVVE
ncbi:MAG: T9SS type A sorting domain-containing protein [Ferruginibacter sp.]|nr:T9SS type A sorting domain-containing protein [Ferruginibacter sp.]